MLEVDVDDLGERRVGKLLSVSEFMLVKPFIIVSLNILDHIVVGLARLDDDLALLVCAASAA